VSQSKLLVCLALFCGLIAVHAQAATVEVGTCNPTFPNYPNIQTAVNSSGTNPTIIVCPGTYPEQVVINKSLTIRGVTVNGSSGALITAPAGGVVVNGASLTSGNPIAAQILVSNPGASAMTVNISDLTVDGANSQINDCTDLIGIVYQNTSGSVTHAGVLNEALAPALNGCQSGLGIYVQSASGGVSTVTVSGSIVQNYQKNGITGNEPGTTMTITGNTVVGQGPTTGAAQNGIQLGFGSTGSVTSNNVLDDVWVGVGAAATGVLIFESAATTVSSNTISNTQYGILLETDPGFSADGATVSGNKINTTHLFDAIDVCSNNNTIQSNTIFGSDQSAIHLDAACTGTGNNNTVKNNNINVACAGLLIDPGTSNVGSNLTPNNFFNVTTNSLAATTCTTPLAHTHQARPHFKAARL
jgi:parallel beta-helix repeat protein